MTKAKSRSLGDEVFQTLLERIQSGTIPPGEVVNESVLAQELGVSRGPVREAIRRLQGIQLVSREAYLKARVTTLTPSAVVELFQMREALEGYACRLAAESMTDDEIAALSADLEATRGAIRNGGSGDLPDFHIRIVQASRNQRIIDALCGDLYRLLSIYRRWSGSTGGRRPMAHREHWQIMRALQLRDPDLSESLMRGHIARAREHLMRDFGIEETSGRVAKVYDSAGVGRSGADFGEVTHRDATA